jgi:S-DNA-T family DNA segregation ATPase FtsK/SpoIIIE
MNADDPGGEGSGGLTSVIVERPPRRPAQPPPSGEVRLAPPPLVPPRHRRGWTRLLTPLPMLAGAAALTVLIGARRGEPATWLAAGMYAVAVVGMLAVALFDQRDPARRELTRARWRYLRELSSARARLRSVVRRQREVAAWRHPHPAALWSLVATHRLWERRPGDPDFAVVRLGLGPQPVATTLVVPAGPTPATGAEPLCASALRRLVATYSTVDDLPVTVDLREHRHLGLRGPGDLTHGLLRAVLAQVATFHAPRELLVAFCVAGDRRAYWEWAKWLPHAWHPLRRDAVGPVRLFAADPADLAELLTDLPADGPAPYLLVVLDTDADTDVGVLSERGGRGFTVLDLSPGAGSAQRSGPVLELGPGDRLTLRTGTAVPVDATDPTGLPAGPAEVLRADLLGAAQAEVLARELAPLRLATPAPAPAGPADDLDLPGLLGVDRPDRFDPTRGWSRSAGTDRLRAPVGLGTDGRPVELDLTPACGHALLVGAAGSGRTELLRALVLGLAVRYGPAALNVLLVHGGGADFTALGTLPHTSAVVDCPPWEAAATARLLAALDAEMDLRTADGGHPDRPRLLVVLDDADDLLTTDPDAVTVLDRLARLGPAAGVHLLLSVTRVGPGPVTRLTPHLGHRLCLRVDSEADSRVALGVPDAYRLPAAPGHGYLRTGGGEPVRFRSRSATAPARPAPATAATTADPVQPYGSEPVTAAARRPAAPAPATGPSVLDLLVAAMAGHGPRARAVWQPPLTEPATLGELLGPVVKSPERGLTAGDLDPARELHALAAHLDTPPRARPWWLDLSGPAGNVAVVGRPGSGRSTLLATLLGSLALRHTPHEVRFHCLDLGGGPVAALAGLPQVGEVADAGTPERVRSVVAEAYALMRTREGRFARTGVTGMADYRREHRRGGYGDEPADVFLVVDGWSLLREKYPDLEPMLVELATRGLAHGVHLLVVADRWADLPVGELRDAFGTRIELRLTDPAESLVDRRAADGVPWDAPGRGVTADGSPFLGALPRIDTVRRVDDLPDAMVEFVRYAQAYWVAATSAATLRPPVSG